MKKYSQLLVDLANVVAVITLLSLSVSQTVPIHFGISGVADAWGPKWTYLIFALVPLILEVFYLVYEGKGLQRVEANRHQERRVTLIVQYFFIGINWAILLIINNGIDQLNPRHIVLVVSVALGAVLMGIYNVIGKVEPNRFIGVRTKSTLNNPQVWTKTNRLSSYIGFFAGLVTLLFGVLNYLYRWVNTEVSLILVLIFVITGSALIPMVLSVYYAKKYQKREN